MLNLQGGGETSSSPRFIPRFDASEPVTSQDRAEWAPQSLFALVHVPSRLNGLRRLHGKIQKSPEENGKSPLYTRDSGATKA